MQDPNFKNRELQIMKMLKHPNIVELVDNFYQKDQEKGDVYLNLILGYMPENLYEVSTRFTKRKEQMPISHIQAYIWQLCRALSYIHSLGICHRDIKPQNLLINQQSKSLRLCDFGSAKILARGESNVSYICSRYYRAPELIFGASFYTCAIDIWSTGCVMAELILGTPMFAGENSSDQLSEIIHVIGTPTRKQIFCMNPEFKEHSKLPMLKKRSLEKVFPPGTPTTAISLISKMLKYTPTHRILPMEALCEPFFIEFKNANTSLGPEISPYFDFLPEEIKVAYDLGVLNDLLPKEEHQKLSKKYDWFSKQQKHKRSYSKSLSTTSTTSSESSSDE
uniref:Protein kinase domain-containing protein n=1 Tax=Arcella intermedia TaxID=1963864 RepID=A0A6B2L5Y5_9EUKA